MSEFDKKEESTIISGVIGTLYGMQVVVSEDVEPTYYRVDTTMQCITCGTKIADRIMQFAEFKVRWY